MDYIENANEKKRNSLPVTFKCVTEEQHPFSQSPPSSKRSNLGDLSSSPTMMDICNEVTGDDRKSDHESISWTTSRRSSGYWSEKESSNEHELNSSLDEKRKNLKSKKELCLIDMVICGNPSARKDPKASSRASSPVVEKAKNFDKNGREPDWHFKKFLDCRTSHVTQKDVKVTDL